MALKQEKIQWTWTWRPLTPMLLPLIFQILTPRARMLYDQTPRDQILYVRTAETIDVIIAEMAGGMTDETLATMLPVTTAEAGHMSTETETVVGLEAINDSIATTCTPALVVVVSGD